MIQAAQEIPLRLPWELWGLVGVHIGAMLIWGGRVHQMLKSHNERLERGQQKFDQYDQRIRDLELRTPRSGHDRRHSDAGD